MKKLNAKSKKAVISVTAGVAAAAIIGGVVFGLRSRGEPVGVYPFSMVGMTEFWGDNQESYGPVTTDRIQTVFLSDTQTITGVQVKEGDTVKKGDVLMTYDTTLSELQLERKRLDVEKANLQVREAEEELARINKLKPMESVDVEVDFPTVSADDGKTIREIYGTDNAVISEDAYDGSSAETPLVVWLSKDRPLDNSLLKKLYATAVSLQIKNAEKPDSSASALPEEDVEEKTPGDEKDPPSDEDQNLSEDEELLLEEDNKNLPTDDGEQDTDDQQTILLPDIPDADQTEMDMFRLTAPKSISIISRNVSQKETIHVRKGDAVNLFFTTDIQQNVHKEHVEWVIKPLSGPLQGMTNGIGNYTLSGIPETVGTPIDYEIVAIYTLDGDKTESLPFTFSLSVEDKEEEKQWSNDFYMVLRVTKTDQQYAQKTVWQGIHVTAYDGGSFGFQLYDAPVTDPLEKGVDGGFSYPEIDYGSGMTAAEIAKLRREQEKKLQELTAAAVITQSEYNLMLREFSDGGIRATLDGVVVSLLTEEEARQNKLPMLKVSGGGGFYVRGSVSELEKDKLKPGQEVSINDWNTGMMYTGTVESIGDFPVQDEGWNGMGNPNASYYPFRVFIDGTADLQEGSYVSVTYSAAEAENGIYLENPFLRTDDGEPYVYVRGKNGRLEKRTVTTGKSLWGSYTEIRSGLTADDYVAFPYGKTVKPGAATVESDLSALYGY